MQIVVFSDEVSKEELLKDGVKPGCMVHYINSIQELSQYPNADSFIHLQFDNAGDEIMILKQFGGLVIINSTVYTLTETDASFVRINAWPGFLSSKLIEGSVLAADLKNRADHVLEQFNKTVEWLPDEPGFITARVISMIINEAYFALEEGVSTKEEIDTAMKLGTAYPFGPFEWAKKIGKSNIVALLNRLSSKGRQYLPAPLLVQEALTTKV